MAVYRGDQAQLTFAAEAAQGGDPEMMEGTLGSATAILKAATAAGSRTIVVHTIASAALVVGDFIRIGTVASTEADTANEHEVRRIEALTGTQQVGTSPGNDITVLLDRPTAFYHPALAQVKEVSAVTASPGVRDDKNKYITFIPGVYESFSTPDPTMTNTGRRFLNTQGKRNITQFYSGQQTLVGSVSGITLLNGWPLRFPIGKVTTIPSAVTGSATLNGDVKKGAVFITLSGSHGHTAGDIIAIYDAADTNNTTKTTEVRKIDYLPQTTIAKLNYPLSFYHATGAYVREQNSATYYDHEIVETVDLDTVSWHVHMRDSAETSANDFDRRYVGGMIGSSTISAEEGGIVTMSWDSVNFLNMLHNQSDQATISTSLYSSDSSTSGMPRFALMQTIDSDDVGMVKQTNNSANTGIGYPSNQPYYFSQGTLKFFGQEFARISNFSLSISNGEEPRYYIGRQGSRMRGPYEIREGARSYSMSATVTLPDTIGSTATTATGATELFKQLLLEGDYAGSINKRGFSCTIRFDRGTSDYIIIDIPTSTTAGSPTEGTTGGTGASHDVTSDLNKQGIFINSANHSPGTDSLLQIDLDMVFRSMRINIRDNEPVYP